MPYPPPVSNRTRRMMMRIVSMSPPRASLGVGRSSRELVLLLVAGRESVGDLVDLVLDCRLGLVGLALVLEAVVAGQASCRLL
jgi:hypothetical protein